MEMTMLKKCKLILWCKVELYDLALNIWLKRVWSDLNVDKFGKSIVCSEFKVVSNYAFGREEFMKLCPGEITEYYSNS